MPRPSFLVRFGTPLLACGAIISAFAPGAVAAEGITEREIFGHVSYLASDELEGRQAGQRGADLAAFYIAEQLREYGFQPLGDAWELPFYVRGGATEGFGALILGNTVLRATNLVQTPTYSPIGVVRAHLETDEHADVAGKIVALTTVGERDERERAGEVIGRGAAGVIFLRDESSLTPTPPAANIKFTSEKSIDELIPELDDDARRQVLQSVRLDAPVISISSGIREYFLNWAAAGRKITIEVRRRGRDASTNVAGVLVGADPSLRHEYVLIGAHYDHLGVQSGEIYPGADDNASGTAAVLEIAEAIATMVHRPRRSIIVVAWGAEELQMIGSKAFCRNPPIDLQNLAAVINLDMVGRNDPGMVQVIAASDDLRGIAVDAANRHGFTDTDGGKPSSLTSTDTASFVKRRIPAVSFHSGLHADYNTLRDTVDRLDIDKITRVARAAFELAVTVANDDARPAFTESVPGLEMD